MTVLPWKPTSSEMSTKCGPSESGRVNLIGTCGGEGALAGRVK